jgi:hypothetical protein
VIYGDISGSISLGILVAILVLDYWAVARIIGKAGFSRLWVIVPLTPFVLLVISAVDLWHDFHTLEFGGSYGFIGIEGIGILWNLVRISVLVNWVMFLVFAFSRWPVESGQGVARSSKRPRGSSPVETVVEPGQRFGPKPGQAPSKPPAASAAPPPPTTPVPAAPTAVVKRCVWCAEPLPGSRALFHDCGSKDRPPAFCATCGAALPENSLNCSACNSVVDGAPAS